MSDLADITGITEPERGRWDHADVWALVAADTFDPLVERIRGLLSHDRRMVRISRYANKTGADNLDITVGLRLDGQVSESGGQVDPIRLSASTFPRPSRHFDVTLAPGLTAGFGFTADDRTAAEMREVWDQRGKDYDQPMTAVRIHGWPNTPGRTDLIEIERWNEHRVCTLTTIAFQADWG